ncbi:ATP-binding protein [Treponema sp.]|uniref:ATP-binding protein n=1 Tax=Treponema sp. TaxID=166 RepID=UPI00298D9D6B|nr:ATP-binding protein [Treponema sp.]MCQ2240009.1 ATP-binding protein [Treponema sp.]
MENNNENVNFKVSSALKDLIGKDLIRNDNVAIFELVKNSYDAYARKVQITFAEDKIIIADNGKGMTFEDLRNKWLFLAYSAKKDGSEDSEEDKQSSYRDLINRHYAGAKGVGRFSCDRLGESLVLTTKNGNSNKVETISVNWNDFEEDQEKIFESIDLHHKSTEDLPLFPDSYKTGTILEISGVRENWDRQKILNLKGSLEKLINPFSETSDFEIELICEKEKSGDEEVRNSGDFLEKDIVNGIIKNSIAKVISLKTTKIEVTLNSQSIKTVLTDRDEKIYELEEENPYNKLSDVTINLYFLNAAAKTAFSKNMGVQPVNYGSIFLFRNGFRILPFGDKDDDSWGLDQRAQQGYNRFLGTRNLFGRVDIQTNNVDEFKESTSRDGGLIKSETTIQLFRLFEIVHRRLERYVTGVLWGEGFLKREYFKNKSDVDKNRDLLKNDKDADSAEFIINNSLGSKIDFINLVKTLINDKSVNVIYYNKDLANIFSQPTLFDDANPQVIDDLERIAEKTNDSDLLYSIEETKKKIAELGQQKKAAEERAEEAETRASRAEEARDTAQYEAKIAELKKEQAENKLSNKIEQLKIVTSLTSKDLTSITSLMHQINVISLNIKDILSSFSRKNENTEIFEREDVIKLLEKITFENSKITSFSRFGFTGIFNNFNQKDKYNIVEFIKNYVEKIVQSITSSNIDVVLIDNGISDFFAKFAPIDISIIFDNMISNAKKLKVSKMIIKMELESNNLILSFDTNKPLDKKISEINEIFELGLSTTKSTGVGLYHIKNIVTENNWFIKAEEHNGHVIFSIKIIGVK